MFTIIDTISSYYWCGVFYTILPAEHEGEQKPKDKQNPNQRKNILYYLQITPL